MKYKKIPKNRRVVESGEDRDLRKEEPGEDRDPQKEELEDLLKEEEPVSDMPKYLYQIDMPEDLREALRVSNFLFIFTI